MLEANVLIHNFPYLGFFILLILGTLGLPFPEDAILILAGFLVANQTISLVPTFLAIYSGLLITDLLLFSFGKRYGRKLVENKGFHRMVSSERLQKLEEKLKKWGVLVIFFGRHLLILRGQVFLAAGAMRMSLRTFLLADALSALITITLWGGLGYVGGNTLQAVGKEVARARHIIVLSIAIFTIGALFLKFFKNRRNSPPRSSRSKANLENLGDLRQSIV
jgi:membrane protein DedA with SNARE-associated domain